MNRVQEAAAVGEAARSNAGLREAVDAALQRGAPLLNMPRDLDERFEAQRWRGRALGTRTWLLVVGIINLVCLAVDAYVLPDYFGEAVVIRGAISAMYFAAAWFLPRQRLPAWAPGLTVCVLSAALVIGCAYLGLLAQGIHTERYFTAVLFATFAATIVPNISFRYTVLQSAVSLFAILAFMLGKPGGTIFENFLSNMEMIAFYPACIIAALDVRRGMERMQRRTFLLSLRDELRVQELAALNDRLTVLSHTDPLTGVFNRRFFDLAISNAWQQAAEKGSWIGIAMVDVDHFKALNDVAGHAEGDRCLRAIASAVRGSVRQDVDLVARYGGEEFVAILPGADLREAASIAERVRMAVENLGLANAGRLNERLTVSVGAVSVQPGNGSLSYDMLLGAADAALYMAKASGRNRVRFAPGIDAAPLVPAEAAEQNEVVRV